LGLRAVAPFNLVPWRTAHLLIYPNGSLWFSVLPPTACPTSIAHFVSLEVGNLIETLARFRFVSAGWPRAVVPVLGMEAVIYVAVKALRTMEPGASANEDAASKPLWAVIAIGSAIVGCDIVVAIGTFQAQLRC